MGSTDRFSKSKNIIFFLETGFSLLFRHNFFQQYSRGKDKTEGEIPMHAMTGGMGEY